MLLFMDGFDVGSITDEITFVKWGDRSGMSLGNTGTILRFGTGSGAYLGFGGSRGDYLRRPIGQNLAAGIIGMAVRFATSASSLYRTNICVLFDTTANVQCALILNQDLTMSVVRQTWSNVLGTSTFAFSPDTWYFVEFKWKISDSISSGDVEVKVDGTVVLTIAAASDTKNTANAYATHYAFGGNSPVVTTTTGNSAWYIDDHYLIDLTGTTNNNYLGIVRVQTLLPDGTGNSSAFVGSDGDSVNNYQNVDEQSPINTSDYNDGVNVGDKDLYTFQDTLTTTNVIKGIAHNIVGLRTDTGARSIASVVRHSGTDYDSANVALNTTGTTHQVIYETNPGTSSGWVKADVDAAQFGAKVTV